MTFAEDPVAYARARYKRNARQRQELWACCILNHRPDMLYRLHNVVYADPRHFFCPASWTDEGWARHGGKDRLPRQIEDAITEALNGPMC